MITGNFKMALASIRASRVRSLLTMLGIVIGVATILLATALAEGVKKSTYDDIKVSGANQIQVIPGRISGGKDGASTDDLLNSQLAASSLSERDYEEIKKMPGLNETAPVVLMNSELKAEGRVPKQSNLYATNSRYASVKNIELEIGDWLTDEDKDKFLIVIGADIARELFAGQSPLGQTITIRGKEFAVRGVFKRQTANALLRTNDLNYSAYISLSGARDIDGPSLPRFQSIQIAASTSSDVKESAEAVKTKLKSLHGGEEDFTVLTEDQALAVTTNLTSRVARLVTAILSISLVIAGIGIMNIMLVSVSERTREIGIRKSIGATNGQIMLQFFTEALILGTYGGFIGVTVSWLAATLVNAYTDVQLLPTLKVSLVAWAVACVIGSVFGLAPAIKAARKDPIKALRGE
jgi:putative ABC transport system permease protein